MLKTRSSSLLSVVQAEFDGEKRSTLIVRPQYTRKMKKAHVQQSEYRMIKNEVLFSSRISAVKNDLFFKLIIPS